MTSWFRSWHGAPTDNKWLVIAAKAKVKPGVVSAIAWSLFDHASQNDDRGSVADFDAETYAVFSGFDESEVQAVITAMRSKGVITEDGRLAAWDKRQPKREDDSADRVRGYRKRQNVTKKSVTQCNAESRNVTHGNNTEAEADTEQNRAEAEADLLHAAAAADPAAAFTDAYKHAWALLPSSEYEQEKITDWAQRVTLEAWEYALRECVDHRHTGQWKYLETILKRVEKEGLSAVAVPSSNGVAAGFTLDDVLGD